MQELEDIKKELKLVNERLELIEKIVIKDSTTLAMVNLYSKQPLLGPLTLGALVLIVALLTQLPSYLLLKITALLNHLQ